MELMRRSASLGSKMNLQNCHSENDMSKWNSLWPGSSRFAKCQWCLGEVQSGIVLSSLSLKMTSRQTISTVLPSNGGGLTLAPGLYKWTASVTASMDVTISGLSTGTDVWIFQILVAGVLSIANAKKVIPVGALAKNIFWQVAGGAVVGTGGHFEGYLVKQDHWGAPIHRRTSLADWCVDEWKNFGTDCSYFAASNSHPAVLRTRWCPRFLTYQLQFRFFSWELV